jgi:hypothetical protein
VKDGKGRKARVDTAIPIQVRRVNSHGLLQSTVYRTIRDDRDDATCRENRVIGIKEKGRFGYALCYTFLHGSNGTLIWFWWCVIPHTVRRLETVEKQRIG